MIAAIHSGFLSATAALFLLASLCRAEDPTPKSRGGESKPAPPSPVGWPATDRDLYPSSLGGGRPFDLLIRGDRSRFGRFDPDGNFIPEPRHESFSGCGPLGGPISFFSNQVTGAVAEHRSGRLILGTMVKGVFVPELGSKVLDIKKGFDIKKPDRIVYNLFWETVPAWTAERKKQFPKGLPNDPEPPPAGVPAGWKLIPFWQADPKQQDPWHVRVIGEIAEFGHLDEQGEFIPDYGLPIVSRNGIKNLAQHPNTAQLYYTLPHPNLGGPKRDRQKETDPEPVYEYRSGRLIKGMLQATGNFVPELGSKVMDFKDYDPDRPPRIYNLPGRFKKAN